MKNSLKGSYTVRPELVEGLFLCLITHMTFWTYMLHCYGGKFYVGHTDNLERRMAQHQHGEVQGFTKDYLPVELVWSEEFPTRLQAMEMERKLKGWGRPKKLALIRGDWDEISRLSRSKRN